MANRFHGILPPPGPHVDGFAVVPSDPIDLPQVTRGVMVGGAGTLVVMFSGSETGTATTITGLVAGVVYPFSLRRIYATGTTATNIVGLV